MFVYVCGNKRDRHIKPFFTVAENATPSSKMRSITMSYATLMLLLLNLQVETDLLLYPKFKSIFNSVVYIYLIIVKRFTIVGYSSE